MQFDFIYMKKYFKISSTEMFTQLKATFRSKKIIKQI